MGKVDIELGALVRDYRLKAGMTQLELAEKLGYGSMQFVSLFERGLSKIPQKVLGKLIIILGIPEKKASKTLTEQFITDLAVNIKDGKKEVEEKGK